MSKSESSQYIEDVRGEIIGEIDVSIRIELYSNHTGNLNGKTHVSNPEDAKNWARRRVAQLKQECGAAFTAIYGTSGFELRIFER